MRARKQQRHHVSGERPTGMMAQMSRYLYVLTGLLCLGCGFLGIFLPLLPTTPFVLLAAFCFSRGSQTLHRWLLTQRTFGPIIRDWNQHGVIRLRVKWISTCLIVLMLSYPIIFKDVPLFAKIAAALVGLGVLVFIWSRPSDTG